MIYKRVILIYLVLINYLYALDARMEIIKTKSNIPQVIVSISAESIKNNLAIKIKDLIEKDLSVSGHFRLPSYKYTTNFNQNPNFGQLKENNIDMFLNISIKNIDTNSLIAQVRLYDVNSNSLVLNKAYSTASLDRFPFLSHKIAITVNDYLGAPTIEWMDNLVIFSRYKDARKGEIVISDYTLTYQKIIISGGLNIFPKWSDKMQESFYYTSLSEDMPVLMKYNLFTGKSERIISSDGMVVCSDISIINSQIILTMAINSQPEIYTYDIRDRIKRRITKYKGIDVGGSFVENNEKIVFVSDRLKSPNIFAKTIGQKGVERLVYHGKNNSQCTTYNNYIVYSSRESSNEFGRNAFNLYLISTDSDFIRRLTSTGRNQFPKFSQDGDSVLFIKTHKGKSYLGIIRLNYNKSFLFPLKSGKLQSIDW